MANTRAAQRYAKAILDLSNEKSVVAEVNNDMRLIANTLEQNQELRDVLQSPVVQPSVKQSILKAIFKEVNEVSSNAFKVLLENNRINLLSLVVDRFIYLYDEANNIKVAKVTTVEPLTPEMEQSVLKKVKELTGSEVTLINKIDASIIGGFILRIGDLQYDASISGKLNSLRKTFNNQAYA
ncbi:ATP synthase F1 subunit delta [Mesonia sp. MT50]|uniref:ATP synthase subunit delta n=1 Tax=Mesonia profundi TaxID=3070998 RepID=A0ABU1A0Q7_9FLAO|nr:ATP synthase F1 subunit delta [Mesonia profundi]MDQ7916573.1 ATP synthase F1 subunit delta [Mesonia profundi]